MRFLKKIVSLFAAVSMLASIPAVASADAGTGEYHDAYTAISSSDYEASSKENIDFTIGGSTGFMAAEGEYVSYLVDFGECSANSLVMNMRPNMNNTNGSFGVYIDNMENDPVIVFDHSKNLPYAGYESYAGPGIADYCFDLPEPITGQHTIYFRALSPASTVFSSFYFTNSAVSAGSQIKPYDYSYTDINGTKSTLIWGSGSFRDTDAGETNVIANAIGALFIPGVDFGDGTGDAYVGANIRMQHWQATPENNGNYEIRLDSIDGEVIGSLELVDAVSTYETYTIVFNRAVTGVHTLVICSPTRTNISYIQCFTAPSAYENYDINLNEAFKPADSEYSYVLDFGDTKPEYLAIAMRPALEDAADSGIIDVYIDDNDTPAASFTTYRNEVNMQTGNDIDNEWFAPLELDESFAGVHTVTFKARTNARSAFYYFRFDEAPPLKNAYQSILATDYSYPVHKGNSMVKVTQGASYVWSFGYWSDPSYYSAVYTNVDFGESTSREVILRVNNLDTLSGGNGVMQIRLGSRYGEVIGTLSCSDMTYNTVRYYNVPLTREISGVQDIVITSNFQTNFYSLSFVQSEESPEAAVTITDQAASGDTIGVKSVVTKDEDAVISSFGTSFIPLALFNSDEDINNTVTVTYDRDIDSGQSYSALLTDIPEGDRGYTVLARSFVELNGEYIWSDTAKVSADTGAGAE